MENFNPVEICAQVSKYREESRNGEWLGNYYSETLSESEREGFGSFDDFALSVLTFQREAITFACESGFRVPEST